jgi:hypothetical protein
MRVMSSKNGVREILVKPRGPKYGGVRFMPGVSGNAWEKANGYLEIWCADGLGIGQLIDIEVTWDDGTKLRHSAIFEPESTVNLGLLFSEVLEERARKQTTETEAGRQAYLLIEAYDFGVRHCVHRAMGYAPPQSREQLARRL